MAKTAVSHSAERDHRSATSRRSRHHKDFTSRAWTHRGHWAPRSSRTARIRRTARMAARLGRSPDRSGRHRFPARADHLTGSPRQQVGCRGQPTEPAETTQRGKSTRTRSTPHSRHWRRSHRDPKPAPADRVRARLRTTAQLIEAAPPDQHPARVDRHRPRQDGIPARPVHHRPDHPLRRATTPALPASGLRGTARTQARDQLAQALLNSTTTVKFTLAGLAAIITDHNTRIAELDTCRTPWSAGSHPAPAPSSASPAALPTCYRRRQPRPRPQRSSLRPPHRHRTTGLQQRPPEHHRFSVLATAKPTQSSTTSSSPDSPTRKPPAPTSKTASAPARRRRRNTSSAASSATSPARSTPS